jgi:Zn-dependent peptidase ImmA (M78 family)
VVFRSGVVGSNTRRPLDVQEFRGFAISDSHAPAIFLNSRDAKTAQIFTLAHELAHVWVGETGISNLDYRKNSAHQDSLVDRFCDQVAAELLVPEAEFDENWIGGGAVSGNLNSLARKFRVSQWVILRRAYELSTISQTVFDEAYDDLLENRRTRASQGGDFYLTSRARNNRTLTHAVVAAVGEGKVPRPEAAALLSVKLGTLAKIESRLAVGTSTDARLD